MTDSDIKSLRAYLTNCLEPALKFAKEKSAEHDQAVSIDGYNPSEVHFHRRMRAHYEGKVNAYNDAINEFRALFSDELEEDEYPEENASAARHPLHCKCAECEDGRGDREHETRRDREIEERR